MLVTRPLGMSLGVAIGERARWPLRTLVITLWTGSSASPAKRIPGDGRADAKFADAVKVVACLPIKLAEAER